MPRGAAPGCQFTLPPLRAETQSSAEASSAANDLLSQFNVASFAMDEAGLLTPPPATPLEGKSLLLSPLSERAGAVDGRGEDEVSWDDIIPEPLRRQYEEEALSQEQLQLYLPPRSRKVHNYCEDAAAQAGTSVGRKRAPRPRPQAVSRRGGEGKEEELVSKSGCGFSGAEIRR